MTDPLSDPIEIEYRSVVAYYRDGAGEHTRRANGDRIHPSRESALAAVAQEARSLGAPEGARIIHDYDIVDMVDRFRVDWYHPDVVGQPKNVRSFESFRLSEVPR
jgi:hypothetical protein